MSYKSPFVSIVTPNLNSGRYIEHTIKSVINQTNKNFEYIVIDGHSKDSSLKIIKNYMRFITHFESKKDNSLYEAVDRGIKIARGNVIIWINSDDVLDKNAVENIIKIFSKNRDISWINGRSGYIKFGIRYSFIPYLYPKEKILNSECHKQGWGFIQQESVAFRKKLYLSVGGFDKNVKYANDFILWKKFASRQNLNTFFIKIGYFRTRKNQTSKKNIINYYKEINKKYIPGFYLNLGRLFFSFFKLPRIIFRTYF